MAQFKPAPALKEYEEALRMDPNRIDALNLIAQILVDQGKAQEALLRVERHGEKVKDRAVIFHILGDINVRAGDPKKGVEYLEKALALNPSLLSAYLKIGDVYARQNAHDRAISEYLKAAERAPKSVQPLMLIATMHDRKKEHAKANQYYEKILALNGNFAPAANNLAWNIAEHGGNLDVALRWAEKARENDPHNPNVADTLGWVVYKRGLFAKSIELLKESSEKFSNKNPAVLYHLGMAYYRGGHRDQARATLSKALSLDRNFTGAAEAHRTMAVLGESS